MKSERAAREKFKLGGWYVANQPITIDGVSTELVETANCGIYVEPGYPEAVAAAIRSLMDQPEKLKAMGANGYKYASEHFDRTVLAKQYVQYMQLVVT
jgi:glycosyltransferase involved in cell wall biosynthesis